MADEANQRRMDLNLYLGLPRSPGRPRSTEDLGSDLALGSMPVASSSSVVQESMVEPLPDPPPQIDEHIIPSSAITDNENRDDFTLYDVFTEVIDVDSPSTPLSAAALPTMHDADELTPTPLYYPSVFEAPVNPNTEFLDGPSPQPQPSRDLLHYPEFRFRRLIESSDRLLVRRLQSSVVPYSGDRLRSAATGSLCSAEQLLQDIVSTPRSMRSNGKEKVSADDSLVEDSDDTGEQKRKSMADFDCNICLDVAKEPVVTSCGHLFCWPCLYQWLHVHSSHKECPVCKGEVVDANITPIYGRGSSGATGEKSEKNGDMCSPNVPPRPRGQRHESFRQQLQRPLLRRFGEGVSWRRIFDEEMPGQSGTDGNRESGLRELIESHQRAFARIREWRDGRENGNTEGGPSGHNNSGQLRTTTAAPHIAATSSSFEDNDIWERLSLRGFGLSERLAAISADLGRVVERLGGSTERLNRNRNANAATASPSSANPQNLEPDNSRVATVSAQASDQASAASSTIAVIEGDVAATPPPAEPSAAGPSRTSRRRGRSRGSSSLDCDGTLHERKRRRLN